MICLHHKIKKQCRSCFQIAPENEKSDYVFCACSKNKYICATHKPATSNYICPCGLQRGQCLEHNTLRYLSLIQRNRFKATIKKYNISITEIREVIGQNTPLFRGVLGCSDQEFLTYIQGLCVAKNFNINQLGFSFHQDHIQPIGGVNITNQERIRRMKYTNIQLLTPAENRAKSNHEI